MPNNPSSRRVATRYLDAALFEPPPAMLDAARYFFVSRWGSAEGPQDAPRAGSLRRGGGKGRGEG
jgi:hypothetical protein